MYSMYSDLQMQELFVWANRKRLRKVNARITAAFNKVIVKNKEPKQYYNDFNNWPTIYIIGNAIENARPAYRYDDTTAEDLYSSKCRGF